MPFDIGSNINNVVDAILKSSTVNTIASSPLYTAMMFSLIMMLLVMIIFRNAETDEPILVVSLRFGFWAFIVLVIGLMMHNRVFLHDKQNDTYSDVFTGGNIAKSILEDAVIPVNLTKPT